MNTQPRYCQKAGRQVHSANIPPFAAQAAQDCPKRMRVGPASNARATYGWTHMLRLRRASCQQRYGYRDGTNWQGTSRPIRIRGNARCILNSVNRGCVTWKKSENTAKLISKCSIIPFATRTMPTKKLAQSCAGSAGVTKYYKRDPTKKCGTSKEQKIYKICKIKS